jgi:membrane protein DedA with SNARE-associated domain
LVVAIVVLASIVGDNLGYWAARNGGRPLLERHRLTRQYERRSRGRGDRRGPPAGYEAAAV